MNKKVLGTIAAMMISGVALTGCGDTPISKLKGKDFFTDSRTMGYFTVQEKNMYESYRRRNAETYTGTLYNTYLVRKEQERVGLPTSPIFFCGAELSLKIDDASTVSRNTAARTLSSHIQEVTGKSVSEWCNVDDSKTKVTFSANPTEVKPEKATIETLRALTEAVKTCNRAKVEIIGKTTDLNNLSQAEAEKIIAQCAIFGLEQELNK